MRRLRKAMLVLVLMVWAVGGLASQGFAVFGERVGDGGQFRDKKGKIVTGAKVRITKILPDGTKKTTETETDDRGFFFLPLFGGDISQIQFIKDGKTSTFSGPFNDLRELSPRERIGSDPDDILLAFDMGASDEEGGIPNIEHFQDDYDWTVDGNGGQFRDKNGNIVTGAKVRVTQVGPLGTTETIETETDNRGFFFLPKGEYEVTQIQFEKDGKVSTFSGPFYDLDEVSPLARPGTDPDDFFLAFHMGDSDEEGGVPNIPYLPNIPIVGDWFGGLGDYFDDEPPWRVQNPGGPIGRLGFGLGYYGVNQDLNFENRNVTGTDFDPSGVPTGSNPPPVSSSDQDALSRDYNPELSVNIAFAEVFANVGSYKFGRFLFDNAFNVKVGAGSVNYEQNRHGGVNDNTLEFTGTVPYVGFGGSHVIQPTGSRFYGGFNWDLGWIPKTSVDGDVPAQYGGTPNTVLYRKNDLSYNHSSVSARLGYIFGKRFAGFLGVGGAWSTLNVDTTQRTDQNFGGFTRVEQVNRELSGSGVFGLAGFDFRVPRSPFFGRVESRFNGDGYQFLFKTTIPALYDVF